MGLIRRARLDHRVRSELRAESSGLIFLTFLTLGSWWPWLGVIRQDPAPAEITTTADTRTQGRQGETGGNMQHPASLPTLNLAIYILKVIRICSEYATSGRRL